MAPTGPRNGAPRNNARGGTSGTSTSRGGISKRRAGGPIRVDRDGDLDMDAAAANGAGGRGKKNNNATATVSTRKSTRTNAPSSRPARPTTKASHMVAKVIQGGIGSLHSRISQGIDPSSRHTRSSRPINGTNNKTLIVEGLQHSKARDNEGGGLKELLIFLERKATTAGKLNHSVRIKKVCVYIRSRSKSYLGALGGGRGWGVVTKQRIISNFVMPYSSHITRRRILLTTTPRVPIPESWIVAKVFTALLTSSSHK